MIEIDEKPRVLSYPHAARRAARAPFVGHMRSAPAMHRPYQREWADDDEAVVAMSVPLGLDDGSFTDMVTAALQPGEHVIIAECRGQMAAAGLARS